MGLHNYNANDRVVEFTVPPSGRKLWNCRKPFVVYWGPAGTGKTRIWCERINMLCHTYPGIRVLMARQFRSSMTQSCMQTFAKEVIKPGVDDVKFNTTQQAYLYPEKIAVSGDMKGYPARSEVVVGGLDDPGKIMSTQYDLIYINEITDIRKEQWEYLKSRNRNGVLPWQQMGGDCNPQFPKHWVKCDRIPDTHT